MLDDSELMVSLAYYEQTYSVHTHDLRVMLLCSKSSILEVCGWIEQAMDLLVTESAKRCTLSKARLVHVEKNYISATSGFSYQAHFEKMIVAVVGYRMLERAEIQAGTAIQAMEGSLTDLTKLRNYYAHTHFHIEKPYPKSMSSMPAPTAMRGHAQIVIAGLSALEQALISLGC